MPWYPRGLQANSILSSEGSDPFRCFVFFWSPGFCLCPFEKVPSDHVVLFSHQNAFLRVLQGRVSQRSHVSQVRARNLTSQTQLSPLNSSWALRGWLSIKMAGTPPHVPEKRRAAVQDQQTDQQTPRAFHGADGRCSTPSIVGIPSGDCQSSSNEMASLLGGFGAGNPVGLEMQTAPVKSQ